MIRKSEKRVEKRSFTDRLRNSLQGWKRPGEQRKKRMVRAGTALACIVAFTTTYALILPAITLDRTPQCGQEEHIHTEDCYAIVGLAEGTAQTSVTGTTDVAELSADAEALSAGAAGLSADGGQNAAFLPADASVTAGEIPVSEANAFAAAMLGSGLDEFVIRNLVTDTALTDSLAAEFRHAAHTAVNAENPANAVTNVASGSDPEPAVNAAGDTVHGSTADSAAGAVESALNGSNNDPAGASDANPVEGRRILICGLEEHHHSRECYTANDTDAGVSGDILTDDSTADPADSEEAVAGSLTESTAGDRNAQNAADHFDEASPTGDAFVSSFDEEHLDGDADAGDPDGTTPSGDAADNFEESNPAGGTAAGFDEEHTDRDAVADDADEKNTAETAATDNDRTVASDSADPADGDASDGTDPADSNVSDDAAHADGNASDTLDPAASGTSDDTNPASGNASDDTDFSAGNTSGNTTPADHAANTTADPSATGARTEHDQSGTDGSPENTTAGSGSLNGNGEASSYNQESSTADGTLSGDSDRPEDTSVPKALKNGQKKYDFLIRVRDAIANFFSTGWRRTAEVSGTAISAEYAKGVLPETALMKVHTVDPEPYSDLIAEVTGKENTRIRAFDLSFRDGSEEVEPDGTVKVTFKADFIDEKTTPQVIHITDDGHAELIPADVTDGKITLTADSFSVYAISYTVDFAYGDYHWSLEGGSSVKLSELFDILGISADVQDVTNVIFSDPDLVKVEKAGLLGTDLLSDGDWKLTSLRPFNTEELLTVTFQDGTVLNIPVTDDQGDTLKTTVTFFSQDSQIYKDGEDPAHRDWGMHITGNLEAPSLTKHYYVLAVLSDNQGNELGWAVQPVELNGKTTTDVSFNAFHPFEAKNQDEDDTDFENRKGSTTDGESIYYLASNNKISTRLFRTDDVLTNPTYNALNVSHTSNATDSPEDGYEFGGNLFVAEKQNEIHIKKSNNKRYRVRIHLDDEARDNITADDHYYVYLKVTHATGEPSYQYAPLVITEEDRQNGYVEYDFERWMDQNGAVKNPTQTNNIFTGNETKIEVALLQYSGDFKPNNYTNATISTEGSAIKSYKVSYNTRVVQPKETTSGYLEESVMIDEREVTYCIDEINLTTIDAEGQYNYSTILGPNLVYGIVAEHLYHENHLQTNFAVNHYTGHGADARPDLSGSSSGNIVIAEYNYQATDYVIGTVPNATGAVVYEENIAGQMHVGGPLNGTLVLYVDENTGSPSDLSTNKGKVIGNLDQSVVIQTDGAALSRDIVEPNIQYGINMSNELARQPVTFDPPIPSQGKLNLDTTAFPEDATIFVNADRIKEFIGKAGQLVINKLDNQTIIFNFNEEVKKNEEITLAQFVVKQPGISDPNGYTTASPVETNAKANEYMDSISRHIVWNLNGVKGTTVIDISGGIFLQPNDDSAINVKGTTAGWIVSDGLVYNGSGEWHNVFSDMPDTNKVQLRALKNVDGKPAKSSQKFQFYLHEYNVTENKWDKIEEKNNVTGSVEFQTIENLTEGWHIYRIHENEIKPAETNGFYIMDKETYYAAVRVQKFESGNGQEQTVVGVPMYYREFNSDAFNPSSPALTGVSGDRITIPTFENETVKKGLSIHKAVAGTTDNTKEFTFLVRLWWDATEEYKAEHSESTTMPIEEKDYTVTGSSGTTSVHISASDGSDFSTGEIILKNGEVLTITDLPEGVHYEITEVKVGEKPINSSTYTDGYQSKTEPQTGTLQEVASVTFSNEYKATGKLDLKAHKVMKDVNGEKKSLVQDQFAFELRGSGVTQTKYNDVDGTVTFDAIQYTEADLNGATLNEDGSRQKTLVYTLHETQGTTQESGFSYSNITYDEDKTITVTLVDDGKGTITATPDVTDATVEFNNTYEKRVSATFDGEKQLNGRSMAAGEFSFHAVLTQYVDADSQSHEYANDEARKDITFVSDTKVTGKNLAADAQDGSAKGAISFPSIVFKQAGTYTYTVTEDTSQLPADVQAHMPDQSYKVRITVKEETDPNNSQETILKVKSITYEGEKTIINDRKKMSFSVTKEWKDSEEQKVYSNRTITFRVTKDGADFSATGRELEKVENASNDGRFTVNEDGTVTLTAGTDAWPTVKFKNLEYPDTANGYVVTETSYTGASENTEVKISYQMDTEDPTDQSPAITQNDSSLIIVNKEEESTVGLRVTKKWVAADGVTDISRVVENSVVYFKLNYVYEKNQYNSFEYGNIVYSISRDSASRKWSTVAFEELPSDPKGWNQTAEYYVVETDENGNPVTENVTYSLNGNVVNIDNPLAANTNGVLTITNTVQPTGIQVLKKWEGGQEDSVQVELWRKPAISDITQPGEGKTEVRVRAHNQEQTYYVSTDKIHLTATEAKGNHQTAYPKATIKGNVYREYSEYDKRSQDEDIVGNTEIEITQTGYDLTIPSYTAPTRLNYITIDLHEHNTNDDTWTYELTEVGVPPTEGEDSPRTGEIVTVDKNGVNLENPITLNSDKDWFYEWTNLPGGYEYYVKETEISGYETTYSNNDGVRKGIITITNTKKESDKETFAFHKIWLDENGNIENSGSYKNWMEDITVTIQRRIDNGNADPHFKLIYVLGNRSPSFTPTEASKRPEAEGEISQLTLTASGSGNIFTFELPDDALAVKNDKGETWNYFVTEEGLTDYVTQYGKSENGTRSIVEGAKYAENDGLIVNQTFGGYELPSTGGIGTRFFTIFGSVLIVLSGAMLMVRRRRKRS